MLEEQYDDPPRRRVQRAADAVLPHAPMLLVVAALVVLVGSLYRFYRAFTPWVPGAYTDYTSGQSSLSLKLSDLWGYSSVTSDPTPWAGALVLAAAVVLTVTTTSSGRLVTRQRRAAFVAGGGVLLVGAVTLVGSTVWLAVNRGSVAVAADETSGVELGTQDFDPWGALLNAGGAGLVSVALAVAAAAVLLAPRSARAVSEPSGTATLSPSGDDTDGDTGATVGDGDVARSGVREGRAGAPEPARAVIPTGTNGHGAPVGAPATNGSGAAAAPLAVRHPVEDPLRPVDPRVFRRPGSAAPTLHPAADRQDAVRDAERPPASEGEQDPYRRPGR